MAATRVQLRDGRYLAYKEGGVPLEKANFKIVVAHGLGSSRHALFPCSKELVEELGIYMVGFDRAGYGDSDAHPERCIKSEAEDITQLADHLELGPKFYLIGISIGGYTAWGCLKYIPERLEGLAMVAPAINYWWPNFPPALAKQAFHRRVFLDRVQLRVAHYAPWLLSWWNKQKWLKSNVATKMNPGDQKLMSELSFLLPQQTAKPEKIVESIDRDLRVQFGRWEFDPTEMKKTGVQVHLWQGDDDYLVPVLLQRFVAKKLPWFHYHEVPGAGHLFFLFPGSGDEIMVSLLSKIHETVVAI